jgi:hypothetical protein
MISLDFIESSIPQHSLFLLLFLLFLLLLFLLLPPPLPLPPSPPLLFFFFSVSIFPLQMRANGQTSECYIYPNMQLFNKSKAHL